MNKSSSPLTQEEIDAGVEKIEDPNELEVVDVSSQHIEKMARGFIMGTQAIGRRKEIREVLEEKVTKRIGRKGKYLTDKLFELIDGVYTVQKESGKEIRYYKVPPSLHAIIYALDRVLGKPTQHTEVNEEKRGIMVIEHIIKNLAGEKNEERSASAVGDTGIGGGDKRVGGDTGDESGRIAEVADAGNVASIVNVRVGEVVVSQ